MLSPEVAATIANYRPTTLSSEVAAFTRRLAAASCPKDAARAKALLFALGKLGAFASSVGLELSSEVCLRPSVIERYIVAGCSGVSAPTRRTLRTNLRFVARRVLVDVAPAPVPLSRERSKTPYSPSEIAGFLALADAQPSTPRRHRLSSLVCLGAGAGLMGAELRGVRGEDVLSRSGGVLVEVRARRRRVVPVLSRYQDRLLASAAFAGEGFLSGGVEQARRNVTGRLVASISGGLDLPPLDVGRLRASWLSECAEMIGLKAFLDAAGITCSQRLGDLVAALPVLSEAEATVLLGGGSSP